MWTCDGLLIGCCAVRHTSVSYITGKVSMDLYITPSFTMSPFALPSLLLQLAVILSNQSLKSLADFGDAFDYGRDETFDKMGEAKIAEFTVTNGEYQMA